ncbi:MAG: hypothetical protein V9H26_13935 [Verrucomicrobiota bacterium]
MNQPRRHFLKQVAAASSVSLLGSTPLVRYGGGAGDVASSAFVPANTPGRSPIR